MSGNILFLGNKIFEIAPFFQTRPGDLGKKVHACSLRFSALNPACHLHYITEILLQLLCTVLVDQRLLGVQANRAQQTKPLMETSLVLT